MTDAADILRFWFEELDEKQHWAKDAALDACIADRSLALGLNTHGGELTNAPVGEAVGIEAISLDDVLTS